MGDVTPLSNAELDSVSEELDRFGIKMLYPSALGGREWISRWDNGHPRALSSGDVDVFDEEFVARGKRTRILIDGHGVARMSGEQPRMYIYHEQRYWCNVEVTFYARRIMETEADFRQAFAAGARSEHQAVEGDSLCPGFAYYGRMHYTGRVNCVKELSHGAYSSNRPRGNPRPNWGTQNGEIPTDRWVGFKFVVRNFDHDSKVRLTLYRDMTEGECGGVWERLYAESDEGDWPANPDPQCCWSPTEVLYKPARSVFIRNTKIDAADYSKFSVREINPE